MNQSIKHKVIKYCSRLDLNRITDNKKFQKPRKKQIPLIDKDNTR